MNSTSLSLLISVLAAAPLAAQWTVSTPATSPSARAGAAMASAPGGNGCVLFGGSSLFTLLNDTWVYDGTNWTQLTPVASPTAKFFTDMAYDAVRGVYVMYGGNSTYTSPGTNETWEFDGTTWTQRFPATNPGNLGLHATVFDSVHNRIVLYGGMPGGNPILDSNKTWEYDGTNWTQRFPATNPGRLEAHSMCFHAGAGVAILFGGVNATSGAVPPYYNNNTWAYDGTNWTLLPITGPRPPMRERATMAYDSVRGVCVLTGGLWGGSTGGGSGTALHDTWELRLSGSTWSWTQTDNPASGGRLNSSMVFLSAERHMVHFGGSNAAGSSFTAQTKEYGAQVSTLGSGCAGIQGVPALSSLDGPRIGETWTVNVANLNPTYNLAILVFGFTQAPGGIDLGPALGMFGCYAWQTPDVLISAPVGAGGSTSWSWSPIPAASGGTFACQALCLDPGATSFGFTVSNSLSALIGY